MLFMYILDSGGIQNPVAINSLAPERFEQNPKKVLLKLISVSDGLGISFETTLRWVSLDWTDDRSTLVQVITWADVDRSMPLQAPMS